jgi:hypothetical protein
MKKKIRHIKTTILAIILLSNSYAQSIQVSVDRDTIFIGEQIELSISYPIKHATSSLQFFEGDSIGNGFEVLEILNNDTIDNQTQLKLAVTNFEIDNKFIPPFTVFYGESKSVSKPISVYVSLMQVDTNQPIKDIKPIIEDILTSYDYLKIVWNWTKKNWWILLIGLILILLIIWFLISKKEPKKKQIAEKKVVPVHLLAVDKLKQLEAKQLWQNGNQKEYNVQLTEIILFYISERYDMPTAEKTSSEIIHSLRFVKMGESNKQNLKKLLVLSDLVKFAKEKPTPYDNESVMKDAYMFIETTKKVSK